MKPLLSIIIPYYKTLTQTKHLFERLEPQLTDEVEVIIIDDGCNEKELDNLKAKVIHLEHNSGGASKPRNVGLDNAQGEYIVFCDSDDDIAYCYINEILNKIKTDDFDYCYFGWQSPHFCVMIDNEPPGWNCCIWNCIYKKSLIGDERFNPNLVVGEDYDFNIRVRRGKRSNILKILYYYSDTPNSLIKRKG